MYMYMYMYMYINCYTWPIFHWNEKRGGGGEGGEVVNDTMNNSLSAEIPFLTFLSTVVAMEAGVM